MRRSLKRVALVTLAVAALLGSGEGPYASGVVKDVTCSIGGGRPFNFGEYSVFSTTPLDAETLISYDCVGGNTPGPVKIFLGSGNGSVTPAQRKLDSFLGDYLNYNLYMNAGRTIIWGDGTDGTATYESPGPIIQPISNRTVPVYFRIPPGQDVIASGYSDQIWMTIGY